MTTTSNLNNVLQYLHDSVNGLNECVSLAEGTDFTSYLSQVSQARASYITEIENLVVGENAEPKSSGSLAGPLHRIFLDLKSYLTSKNNESIKNEILRGDEVLIKAYNEALQHETAAPVKDLLSKQLQEIHQALVKITELSVA
jgi:uncharacterized protein (TIGR02284 family)